MSDTDTKSNLAEKYAANPNIPRQALPGLMAMNQLRPLANAEPADILDRLLAGESVQAIAAGYEIHRNAVYAWLLKYCPDTWMELQTARQLGKLDECEEVWDADYSGDARADGVGISRAREKMRQAQWHLERANRKLFGQDKQDVTVNLNNISKVEWVVVSEQPAMPVQPAADSDQ